MPLAAVRDPSAVDQAVLDALGVARSGEATAAETLVDTLRDRAGLIVLDNCEHVLEAVSSVAASARDAGATVALLATSRQRLDVAGDRVVTVPLLEPNAAGALFAQRVAELGVTLDPGSVNVLGVCQRLDYLPLALELASAHIRILGVDQLAELLDERMALLAGSRSGDGHHESLVTAISSSYDTLEPSMQRTLCRFSVFAGAFDLQAAMALAQAGTDLEPIEAVKHLVELADRSLVAVEGSTGEPSYRLLESVRLFCAALLDNPAAAQAEHVSYYRRSAEERYRRLNTREYEAAFAEVAGEWGNHRAAIANAIELDRIDDAMGILNATLGYAHLTQRLEHADWSAAVLAAADASEPRIDQTRAGLAMMLVLQELDRAAELAGRGGDPTQCHEIALTQAWCAHLSGDAVEGERLAALALSLVAGTAGLCELNATAMAAFLRTRSGIDPTEHCDRLDRLAVGAGPIARGFQLWTEISRALRDDDVETAIDICDQLAEHAASIGLELLVLAASTLRSRALATHPDLDLVAARLRDGLVRYRRRQSWTMATSEVPIVARVLHESGRSEAAIQLLGNYRAAHGASGG